MVFKGRYDLIIFDWDGTLIDSIPRILTCFRATFAAAGSPTPDDHRIKATIGLPLRHAFQQLTGREDAVFLDRLCAGYRHFWLDAGIPISPLFAGVNLTLERISRLGTLLAVATGKSRAGLERDLGHHGLDGYFATSRCGGETAAKPAPAMLEDILRTLGVGPERALMVGDSILDMEMAANAGMDAIGVCTGSHTEPDLQRWNPRCCIADVTLLDSFVWP